MMMTGRYCALLSRKWRYLLLLDTLYSQFATFFSPKLNQNMMNKAEETTGPWSLLLPVCCLISSPPCLEPELKAVLSAQSSACRGLGSTGRREPILAGALDSCELSRLMTRAALMCSGRRARRRRRRKRAVVVSRLAALTPLLDYSHTHSNTQTDCYLTFVLYDRTAAMHNCSATRVHTHRYAACMQHILTVSYIYIQRHCSEVAVPPLTLNTHVLLLGSFVLCFVLIS